MKENTISKERKEEIERIAQEHAKRDMEIKSQYNANPLDDDDEDDEDLF